MSVIVRVQVGVGIGIGVGIGVQAPVALGVPWVDQLWSAR